MNLPSTSTWNTAGSNPLSTGERAIKRFSEQAELEVFYPSSATAGLRTHAVKGRMTAREALDAMLAGTDLVVVQDEKTGAFSVRRTGDRAADPGGTARRNARVANTSGETPVTGRVLNENTKQYLRSAVVSVIGTTLSTITESGGVSTLNNVPSTPYINNRSSRSRRSSILLRVCA